MNKLQLEGLVKAGAFDSLNKIDNLFLTQFQIYFKNKKYFENKVSKSNRFIF